MTGLSLALPTFAVLTLSLPVSDAQAAETAAPAIDKSAFNLFNPVPNENLRELSTDRPGKTESAYTLDAGHVQIEADVFSFAHDKDTGTDSWAIAPVNLKLGLLKNVDLQTVVESYNHVTVKDPATGFKTRQSGFGDVTSRLKVNLWGNDGGSTAMALMPFVKAPTNQDHLGNNSVEGGLILPLAVQLPAGWDMGLMTEFDFNRNDGRSGHHAEFINTVTFGHDIVGKLGGYIEFFSLISAESGAPWIGTVDLGLTYGLTDNIQLDAGVNLGVTRSADDFNPFLGISFRF